MDDFDIINSKRYSGKTVLMSHIVQHFIYDFDQVFLISPTEKMTKQFQDVVKPQNIFDEYSENWVEALMNKMTQATMDCYDKPERQKKHVLLILDD